MLFDIPVSLNEILILRLGNRKTIDVPVLPKPGRIFMLDGLATHTLNLTHLPILATSHPALEPLHTCLDHQISSSIFIRRSYSTMFEIVLAWSVETLGKEGLVINGQPGIMGRLLEPIAHRQIADTVDGYWPLSNMIPKSNNPNRPLYTLARLHSPLPDTVQFAQVKRKTIHFHSIDELSQNSYYIPWTQTSPYSILWVIQITTSRVHRGSSEGYQRVRETLAILEKKLDSQRQKDLQWQFPDG